MARTTKLNIEGTTEPRDTAVVPSQAEKVEPTERRHLPEAEEEGLLSPPFFCFSLSRRDMWGSDASAPVVPLAWRAERDHITVEMWGWTLWAGSGFEAGREKGRAKPALCGPQDGALSPGERGAGPSLYCAVLKMARSSRWRGPQYGVVLNMAPSSRWSGSQDGA